jgi:hypothetical protein
MCKVGQSLSVVIDNQIVTALITSTISNTCVLVTYCGQEYMVRKQGNTWCSN